MWWLYIHTHKNVFFSELPQTDFSHINLYTLQLEQKEIRHYNKAEHAATKYLWWPVLHMTPCHAHCILWLLKTDVHMQWYTCACTHHTCTHKHTCTPPPPPTHTHTHTCSVMLYTECQQNVITLTHSFIAAEVSKVHPTGTYPSEPGVGQPSGWGHYLFCWTGFSHGAHPHTHLAMHIKGVSSRTLLLLLFCSFSQQWENQQYLPVADRYAQICLTGKQFSFLSFNDTCFDITYSKLLKNNLFSFSFFSLLF